MSMSLNGLPDLFHKHNSGVSANSFLKDNMQTLAADEAGQQ